MLSDLFKKIRDTKETFHAKMGLIKDRNGMDLTEAEDIKKRWQEYTEVTTLKSLFSCHFMGFPGGSRRKETTCQCRRCKRRGFDPGLERFPGESHGNPLQYSCLENSMDRGAWWATVHRVTQSQT